MRFFLLLYVVFLLPFPAFAGAIEEGKSAIEGKDWATAVKILQPLAEQGNPEAQWIIAGMHSKGHGFARNQDEAFDWYQKSADQGYAPAELEMGFRSEVNKDLQLAYGGRVSRPHSNIEALKWFSRAAEHGNADGEEQIGYLYANGSKEIPKDENEAMKWFRRAAEHGNGVSQFNLGLYYRRHSNYSEALKWLQLAAEKNIAGSRIELAKAYASGEGANQDYPRAYMWTHLQTEPDHYGLYQSTANLFVGKMTPEQIAEGKRLVNEWRANHSLSPAATIDYQSIRSGKH